MLPARVSTHHVVNQFAVHANVIPLFENVFFTRFALIPWRALRETTENIDTDLADAMDR